MILFFGKLSGLHGELKVRRMETMRKGGDAEEYLCQAYKRKKVMELKIIFTKPNATDFDHF